MRSQSHLGTINSWALITTIALSAFLLFVMELLTARLVLPVFGGTPSVWATGLCFYSGMVFLGYAYAHAITRKLTARAGALVHLALICTALLSAFMAPTHISSLRFESVPTALNVLFVFAVLSALPAFLLSATTPLLSARYARQGSSPWWLYAASNAASLIGLLAYPFAIQPFISLSMQRDLLAVGIAVVAVGLAVVLNPARRSPREAGSPQLADDSGAIGDGHPDDHHRGLPPLKRQALWVAAAFVPSGLLSATTSYVGTDVTATPLLWVIPLAIYLGSMVIAFSEKGRRVLPTIDRLVPAAATLMWVPYVSRGSWLGLPMLLTVVGSYAVLAIAIHGRLAVYRPDAANLTRFYLLISLGGFAATAVVALLAPVMFHDIYEYPILITAGLAVLALMPTHKVTLRYALYSAHPIVGAVNRLAPYAVAFALMLGMITGTPGIDVHSLVGALLVGGAVLTLSSTPKRLALLSGLAILALSLIFTPIDLARDRSFFGVTDVRSARNGEGHYEVNGITIHGIQIKDIRRTEPTSYYVISGPVGSAVQDMRQRLPQGGSIGVVGLGIGTMAAHQRAVDTITFFEIDPVVIRLALDPKYFTYLSQSPNTPKIILGDGRLSIAEYPSHSLDLLVLDAFSSGAVPAHMMTAEAMRQYDRVLKPGGLILFNLSNTYFDLAGAVSSTARSVGMETRLWHYKPTVAEKARLAAHEATWLAVGRRQDVTRLSEREWRVPPTGPILTDDQSDILRLLVMRW